MFSCGSLHVPGAFHEFLFGLLPPWCLCSFKNAAADSQNAGPPASVCADCDWRPDVTYECLWTPSSPIASLSGFTLAGWIFFCAQHFGKSPASSHTTHTKLLLWFLEKNYLSPSVEEHTNVLFLKWMLHILEKWALWTEILNRSQDHLYFSLRATDTRSQQGGGDTFAHTASHNDKPFKAHAVWFIKWSLVSISGRLLYISRLLWLGFYNVEQQFKGSGTLDGPNLWPHTLTVELRARV